MSTPRLPAHEEGSEDTDTATASRILVEREGISCRAHHTVILLYTIVTTSRIQHSDQFFKKHGIHRHSERALGVVSVAAALLGFAPAY